MTRAVVDRSVERVRLLVVDDDEETRTLLCRQLAPYYQIDEAANGEQAFEKAEATLPDLILADIMMPVLDGFGLLRVLRDDPRTQGIPLILVSARTDEESRVQGLEAGANDYLVKPFSSRELRARIKAHVELGRFRQAAARRQKEYTARLQKLAQASLLINSNLSVEGVLQTTTEEARQIVGSQLAMTSMTTGRTRGKTASALSHSEQYEPAKVTRALSPRLGFAAQVRESNRPMRLTQDELEKHAAQQNTPRGDNGDLPLRGWLAAPLFTRDGKNQGLIQLVDKVEGEFSEEDEAVLVQLAQLASVALENARLYDAEAHARREAEAANAIKLQFLAMVSHELRTPLTSIKGFATTLLARDVSFDPDTQTEFISIINAEAERLTNLIEQLLDLSGLQAGTLRIMPEEQSIGLILDSTLPQLEMLAANHRLALDIPPDLPNVIADAQRIGQVLSNLVGNAVKYAPEESTITIAARDHSDRVIIEVMDDGPGIPPEAHDYIFEAFRQVEKGQNTQKGTGLGLAICKGLVTQHGGDIWIDDGVERGTKISFTLPAADS